MRIKFLPQNPLSYLFSVNIISTQPVNSTDLTSWKRDYWGDREQTLEHEKEIKPGSEWIEIKHIILEKIWITLKTSVSLSHLSWTHVICWLFKHCLETNHCIRTNPRHLSVLDLCYGVCWYICVHAYIHIYNDLQTLSLIFGLVLASPYILVRAQEREVLQRRKASQILCEFQ